MGHFCVAPHYRAKDSYRPALVPRAATPCKGHSTSKAMAGLLTGGWTAKAPAERMWGLCRARRAGGTDVGRTETDAGRTHPASGPASLDPDSAPLLQRPGHGGHTPATAPPAKNQTPRQNQPHNTVHSRQRQKRLLEMRQSRTTWSEKRYKILTNPLQTIARWQNTLQMMKH